MDVLFFAATVLAVFGFVASALGTDTRDGWANDARSSAR